MILKKFNKFVEKTNRTSDLYNVIMSDLLRLNIIQESDVERINLLDGPEPSEKNKTEKNKTEKNKTEKNKTELPVESTGGKK